MANIDLDIEAYQGQNTYYLANNDAILEFSADMEYEPEYCGGHINSYDRHADEKMQELWDGLRYDTQEAINRAVVDKLKSQYDVVRIEPHDTEYGREFAQMAVVDKKGNPVIGEAGEPVMVDIEECENLGLDPETVALNYVLDYKYDMTIPELSDDANFRNAYGWYGIDLDKIRDFCNIDDILQYKEIRSSIDRYSSVIVFAQADDVRGFFAITEDKQGRAAALAEIIKEDTAIAGAYLDNEFYTITEYSLDGEDMDKIEGIYKQPDRKYHLEDYYNFDELKKLGDYKDLEECMKEHEDELGIEVDEPKPLKDRVHRKNNRER